MSNRWVAQVLLALSCLWAVAVPAQEDQAAVDPHAIEVQRAEEAVRVAAQPGPRAISLGDQAALKLPEGLVFIPKPQAENYMKAIGNNTGPDFLGLVMGEDLSGFVTIDFVRAGYIKDDEAKDWNADELLQNLKEGTEAGNEDRRKRGIPEFEVLNWIEKPSYDAANHRLVWSAALQNKAARADEVQGVNYNTYVLGREGYLELNLVSDKESIETEKPIARALLAAVGFNESKRYGDFNASTDKVAEYGLAALVGGIAIKKLGLLATIGLFLAKAWKLVAVGVFAAGAGARKFFGGKKQGDDAS